MGVKWVAVAPFELKLGPNESYGRAASVNPPPGAKKAQIRAKIRVKLQGSAAWGQPLIFRAQGEVRRHGHEHLSNQDTVL